MIGFILFLFFCAGHVECAQASSVFAVDCDGRAFSEDEHELIEKVLSFVDDEPVDNAIGALIRGGVDDDCFAGSLFNVQSDVSDEIVMDDSDDDDADCLSDDKLSPRSKNLLARLRVSAKGVCFSDVQNSLYRGCRLLSFQRDVQQILICGFDLRCNKDSVFYHGIFDKKCDPPQKSVALAMFDFLKKQGLGEFQLHYHLYQAGYRNFPISRLQCLQTALALGGVHPCGKEYYVRCLKNFQEAQRFWEEKKHVSVEEFEKLLMKQDFDARYRRSLVALWKLQESKELEVLKALMDSPEGSSVSDETFCCRGAFQAKILEALRAQKDPITVSSLALMVGRRCPKRDGAKAMLPKVLNLVTVGCHVFYDKVAKKVKLLKEKPLVDVPKGFTLEAMVYERLLEDGSLCFEELVYEAYLYGFYDIHMCKQSFQRKLTFCKRLLVVDGLLRRSVLPQRDHMEITRLGILWKVVQSSGEVKSAAQYNNEGFDGVTDDNVSFLHAVKDFSHSEDYTALMQYIAAKGGPQLYVGDEVVVREYLLENGVTSESVLWGACKARGLKRKSDLWEAAGSLAEMFVGGCLRYDSDLEVFYWDPDGCAPMPRDDECAVRVFELRAKNPTISEPAITLMLRQEGFLRSKRVNDVQRALHSLEALGLLVGSAPLAERQRFVRVIMCKGFDCDEVVQARKINTLLYPLYTATKIVSWVKDGTMQALWAKYLSLRGSMGDGCIKRQKLSICYCAEAVLQENLPEVYWFLQKVGALDEEAGVCFDQKLEHLCGNASFSCLSP